MFQESFSPLDQSTGSGLNVQPVAFDYLRTAGKWGKFIAIANFVFIGLTIFGFIFGGVSSLVMLASMGSGLGGGEVFMTLFIGLMGISILFGAYLNYKLYLFSTNAIRAADLQDSQALTISIASLKTLLKVFGVILAIFLGFYALLFLFAILGTMASGI